MTYLSRGFWIVLVFTFSILVWASPMRTQAQVMSSCPTPTQYTVQPGDVLSLLAERFGTDVDTLMHLNGLTDPNHIEVGQVLLIPCPVTLDLYIQAAVLGGIASGLGLPQAPAQGKWLTLWHARANLYRQLAARQLPIELGAYPLTARPGDVVDLEIRPLTRTPITTSLRLFDTWEPFVADGEIQRGFIPLHGFTEPGLFTATLGIQAGRGMTVTVDVPIWIEEKAFGVQYINLPPSTSSLLDPKTVRSELDQLQAVWTVVSGPPLWEGPFSWPVDIDKWPTTAPYGGRRSYNGGPIRSYHTGQDIAAPEGTPVYAPAAGNVVLAEPLHVRGNAVVIDHGAGVMSNYWHLSQISVKAGEHVERGQLLGYVGTTGLSTGAHLHWEIRVYGIPVDPVPWTQAPGPATWWK